MQSSRLRIATVKIAKSFAVLAVLCAVSAAQTSGPSPDPCPTDHAPQASAAHHRGVFLIGNSETRRRIEDRLSADCQLEFTESPLRDVAAILADRIGEPVRLDVVALEDAGIDPDTCALTASMRGMPLRASIREVLGPVDLVLITQNDILKITTKDQADQFLEPRLHQIYAEADARGLIDVLQATVAPLTWSTVGGSGSIELLLHGQEQWVVVSQTQEVHDQVESFLANLQKAFTGAGVPFASGSPAVRSYVIEDADARDTLAEKLVDLCNGLLAEQADDSAAVAVFGKAVVVRSRSPQFHRVAAQFITAVAGALPGTSAALSPAAGGSF